MPSTIDPGSLELAAVLTAAGATVAAALIASVIQLTKYVPGVGAWIDNGREAAVAELLALLLVVYAFLGTTPVATFANVFAAFLAFVGIAALATKAYDVANAATGGKLR